MEKYWQLLFYNLYLFEKFTTNLFGWPFKKIMNIKWIRKVYKKRGVEKPVELITDSFNHLDDGMNIMFAFGAFSFIIFFLALLTLSSLLIIFNIYLGINIFFLILTAILGYGAEHFLIQKDSNYKSYFVEFDKYSTKKKILNAVFTAIFIISVVTISSLTYFYTLNSVNFAD